MNTTVWREGNKEPVGIKVESKNERIPNTTTTIIRRKPSFTARTGESRLAEIHGIKPKLIAKKQPQQESNMPIDDFKWAVIVEKLYQHDGTVWRICGATRQWNNGVRETAHTAEYCPKKELRTIAIEPVANFD